MHQMDHRAYAKQSAPCSRLQPHEHLITHCQSRKTRHDLTFSIINESLLLAHQYVGSVVERRPVRRGLIDPRQQDGRDGGVLRQSLEEVVRVAPLDAQVARRRHVTPRAEASPLQHLGAEPRDRSVVGAHTVQERTWISCSHSRTLLLAWSLEPENSTASHL